MAKSQIWNFESPRIQDDTGRTASAIIRCLHRMALNDARGYMSVSGLPKPMTSSDGLIQSAIRFGDW